MRRALRLLVWALPIAALACSAAFNGSTFRGDGFAFTVSQPPASWHRLDASKASLAFRDPASLATIALNGRCKRDSDDVPLASLTQHLFLQFTDREIVVQEVVPFDGREAMHTVMAAKLDGVIQKFDVWVLKKDGCVYDLLFIAPPDRFERGVGAFTELVKSFHATASDG